MNPFPKIYFQGRVIIIILSHNGVKREYDVFPDEDIALVFLHNDLPSTIIVQDDKIVGVIDWERSGFLARALRMSLH